MRHLYQFPSNPIAHSNIVGIPYPNAVIPSCDVIHLVWQSIDGPPSNTYQCRFLFVSLVCTYPSLSLSLIIIIIICPWVPFVHECIHFHFANRLSPSFVLLPVTSSIHHCMCLLCCLCCMLTCHYYYHYYHLSLLLLLHNNMPLHHIYACMHCTPYMPDMAYP